MLYYVFEEGSGRRRRTKKLTLFNGFSRGNSFIKQVFLACGALLLKGEGVNHPIHLPENYDFSSPV